MKVWTTALCTIAAIAFAAVAADKPAEGAKAKAPGHVITGEITKISADSITVKSSKAEVTAAIDAKTKFGSKAEPKTCGDFKCGDRAAVSYKEDGDKKTALSVRTPAPPKKK